MSDKKPKEPKTPQHPTVEGIYRRHYRTGDRTTGRLYESDGVWYYKPLSRTFAREGGEPFTLRFPEKMPGIRLDVYSQLPRWEGPLEPATLTPRELGKYDDDGASAEGEPPAEKGGRP